jgi:hypothetical protein
MYDIYTNLFILFVFSVIVFFTLGPTNLVVLLVQAVVIWVVFQYMNMLIPWWIVWIFGIVVLFGFLYYRNTTTPTYVGGRR